MALCCGQGLRNSPWWAPAGGFLTARATGRKSSRSLGTLSTKTGSTAGMRHCFAPGGPAPSSAQAEAFAALAALYARVPAHVALDCKAVAARLAATSQGQGNRRLWQQQVDGDLWKCISKAIARRGCGPARVTKVRGRASDGMARTGNVLRRDSPQRG
eukprot:11912698-Alexandrium_andersonii.AAC.1